MPRHVIVTFQDTEDQGMILKASQSEERGHKTKDHESEHQQASQQQYWKPKMVL